MSTAPITRRLLLVATHRAQRSIELVTMELDADALEAAIIALGDTWDGAAAFYPNTGQDALDALSAALRDHAPPNDVERHNFAIALALESVKDGSELWITWGGMTASTDPYARQAWPESAGGGESRQSDQEKEDAFTPP